MEDEKEMTSLRVQLKSSREDIKKLKKDILEKDKIT